MFADSGYKVDISAVTEAMRVELSHAAPVYALSRFWEELGRKNEEMLSGHGLDNLKRTVAQNYYNWLITDPRNNQFKNLLKQWFRRPTPWPLFNKMERVDLIRTIDGLENRIKRRDLNYYKLFVGLLWEFVRRIDKTGLIEHLSEPQLGNPIRIWRGRQLISQDLANSIRECNFVVQNVGHWPVTVGELGAGYGRLAYVFLQRQETRYYIFDVPPALAVSQWYLSRLFHRERIFRFRHFHSFASIEKELNECRIAFFTPNQLELLPAKSIDTFITISTLPEMRPEQIDHYQELMAVKAACAIYLKQWIEWKNDQDNFLFHGNQLSFPGFKQAAYQVDAVQDRFFEAIWLRCSA